MIESERKNRRHVRWKPVNMNRQNCLRTETKRTAKRVWIKGVSGLIHIHKYRFGPASLNRGNRCHRRMRHSDDLISGANATCTKRHEKGIRSRCDTDCISYSKIRCKFPLERIHLIPEHITPPVENATNRGVDLVTASPITSRRIVLRNCMIHRRISFNPNNGFRACGNMRCFFSIPLSGESLAASLTPSRSYGSRRSNRQYRWT